MSEPKQLCFPFGASFSEEPQQLLLFPNQPLPLHAYTYETAQMFASDAISEKFLDALLHHDTHQVELMLQQDHLFLSGLFGHEVMKFAMLHSREDMWKTLLTIPQHWRTVFDEDDRDMFSTLDVWAVLKLPTERLKSLLDWGAIRLWGIFDRTIKGTVFDTIMFYGSDELVAYVQPAWEQHLQHLKAKARQALTLTSFETLFQLAQFKERQFHEEGVLSNEQDFLLQRFCTRQRNMLQTIAKVLDPECTDPFESILAGRLKVGHSKKISQTMKRFFLNRTLLDQDVTFLLQQGDLEFWGEVAPYLSWKALRPGLMWFLEQPQGSGFLTESQKYGWERGIRRMMQIQPQMAEQWHTDILSKHNVLHHAKHQTPELQKALLLLATDAPQMTPTLPSKRKI